MFYGVIITDSTPYHTRVIIWFPLFLSSITFDSSDREEVDGGEHHPRKKGKQASGFNHEWIKGGEHWLQYVSGKGMFCTVCRKYDKRPYNCATWNKEPCTRYRLQSITAHETCAAHSDSLKLELAATTTPSISEAIVHLPEVPVKGIEKAFSCLYFLAKRRIPHTTNYEPFLDCLSFLAMNIKAEISLAKNATYTSDKAIQEMLYVLSEVIEMGILKEMKESDHFALMFDETTDCTMTEQLAVHARYIHKDTGEMKSHYLKAIDVLKPEVEDLNDQGTSISVGANTITKRITEYVEEVGLDMAKTRGIGTDGAATMTGCRNGVVARLKQTTPSAIGVHCAAHRLNLAIVIEGPPLEEFPLTEAIELWAKKKNRRLRV